MLWDVGGTDLLLTVGAPPLLRLNGELRPADAAPLTAGDTETMLAEVLTDDQRVPGRVCANSTSRSRGAIRPASAATPTPNAA